MTNIDKDATMTEPTREQIAPRQGIASGAVERAVQAGIDETVRVEGERENGPFVFSYAAVEQGILAAILAMRQVEAPDVGELREVLVGLNEVADEMGRLLSIPGYNRVKDAIMLLERLTSQGGG